jgi:hypothetical protein
MKTIDGRRKLREFVEKEEPVLSLWNAASQKHRSRWFSLEQDALACGEENWWLIISSINCFSSVS